MSIHPQKQLIIEDRSCQTINQGYSFINKLPRSVGVEYDHKVVGTQDAVIKPFDKTPRFITFGSDDHYELRTVPAKGDALLTTLLIVKEIAKKSRPESYSSWGYHVHVDALDLTTPELIRFAYIYQYIEGTIHDHVIHPTRRGSRYAPTLRELPSSTDLTKTGLVAFCTKAQTKDMLHHVFWKERSSYPIDFESQRLYNTLKNSNSRWWPYNLNRFSIALCQLGEHGTIEFRSKEAVANNDPIEDIVYWPLFCGWLIESVKRTSDHEVVRVLDPNYKTNSRKQTHSLNFLEKFIPKPIVEWFTNHAYCTM